MKHFICKYFKSYRYGAFDEYHYIVVANTETEALGLCLEQEIHTIADKWDIYELPQTVGATLIYGQNA